MDFSITDWFTITGLVFTLASFIITLVGLFSYKKYIQKSNKNTYKDNNISNNSNSNIVIGGNQTVNSDEKQ